MIYKLYYQNTYYKNKEFEKGQYKDRIQDGRNGKFM